MEPILRLSRLVLTVALILGPAAGASADPFQDRSDGFSLPGGLPAVPPAQDRFFGSGASMPSQRPNTRRVGEEPAPPKAQTPQEKAAAISRALAPRRPVSVARRQTLDELYGKLAGAQDEDEAKGLASLIGTVWMRSGSDTAALLMTRAVAAIEVKNYSLALQVLDRLVVLQPAWPEAWNKRASARFFAGDLDGAMADVGHVLKLEPRHFGALDGLATILQRTGFDKRALEIYRRVLVIYPHQPAVEKIVEKLTLEVEGQGI